ncbi:hypothetical protein ACJX0J_037607, partial [Zea mays]
PLAKIFGGYQMGGMAKTNQDRFIWMAHRDGHFSAFFYVTSSCIQAIVKDRNIIFPLSKKAEGMGMTDCVPSAHERFATTGIDDGDRDLLMPKERQQRGYNLVFQFL